jgi:hypothetical protein
MSNDPLAPLEHDSLEAQGQRKRLSDAAVRALAEATERRAQAKAPRRREINGRDGPDPVRYGDWEVRGIASDF